MNLKIENLGKIRSANILVNGITVVAGDNGTGKSTLGRCLTTYANAMRQMDSLVRDLKLWRFIAKVVPILGLSELAKHYLWAYAFRNSESINVLSPELWGTPDSVRKIVVSAAGMYHEEAQVRATLDAKPINVGEIVDALNEINNAPFASYEQTVLDDCFRASFKRQITPLADKLAKGFVSVFNSGEDENDYKIGFKADNVISVPKEIRYQLPPVMYIEPLHALDLGADRAFRSIWGFRPQSLERYGAGAFDLDSIIANRNYDVNYDGDEHNAILELVAELIKIIRGGLEEVDENLVFRENFTDDKSAFVELENLASGAKTMSLVVHALRNGSLRSNRILVVDEPESNLHPDWQVKFAHALVMLHKKIGVCVLLNTHSPYFLKAVEYYAEKEGVEKETNYYLMQKEPDGALYTPVECTGDTNVIFQTMYAPFTEIM